MTQETKKMYSEWIKENWIPSGGLISQVQAAKILSVTRGRIYQMLKENKLKAYNFENDKPLISLNEIWTCLNKEEKK